MTLVKGLIHGLIVGLQGGLNPGVGGEGLVGFPSFHPAGTAGNSLERTTTDGLGDFSTLHTAGSVGAWVRLDASGGDETVMHSRWLFSTQQQFHAGFASTLEPKFYYTSGGSNATLTTRTAATALTANTWTHVLWAWDATSLELYVDFQPAESFGGVTMYSTPTSDYHVGGSDDGTPFSIQRVANPVAWDVKLSDADVAALDGVAITTGDDVIFSLTKNARDQSGNGNHFNGLATLAIDYDEYPLTAPPYEFYTTQLEWESKLGETLHWGVVFNGGALPFEDMVGSNDIDVALEGTPTLDAVWPGAGGGGAYRQNGATNQRISSTNTDFLTPSTGNWTVMGAFQRAALFDDSFSGIFEASNGNGTGIRFVEEHGSTDNRFSLSAENTTSNSRTCSMSVATHIFEGDIVYFMLSRISATRADAWVAVEGSGAVLHENVALVAGDDFDSTSAAMIIGRNSSLGSTNTGTMIKGILWCRGLAADNDLFDTFRGTARTSITEV